MKFDAKLYIERKIKDLLENSKSAGATAFEIENMQKKTDYILNEILSVCGKDIDKIQFGSINEIKDGENIGISIEPKMDRGVDVVRFNVVITNQYGCRNIHIYTVMQMEDADILMKDNDGVVIISEPSDEYRGIYYFEPMNMLNEVVGQTTLKYYDGETLDTIRKVYSSDEELYDFIFPDDRNLRRYGFNPDFETNDFNRGLPNKSFYNAFTNGDREKFDEWINNIKKEENKKSLKKPSKK